MVDISRRYCGLRFTQHLLERDFRAYCEGKHSLLSIVFVGIVWVLEALCFGLRVWLDVGEWSGAMAWQLWVGA
jgi:hypothetical protein